jgi:hypothetical protein
MSSSVPSSSVSSSDDEQESHLKPVGEMTRSNEESLDATLERHQSFQAGEMPEKATALATEFDMVQGRAAFSGSCCEDIWFGVANTHPLLSICFAHNRNPLSKIERGLIQVFSAAIAVGPTAYLSEGGIVGISNDGVCPCASCYGSWWEAMLPNVVMLLVADMVNTIIAKKTTEKVR